MVFDITSPSTFITEVSTFSISTLKKSTIKLKVVYIDGNFFVTRRNKESRWYKNLLNKNARFLGPLYYLNFREGNLLKSKARTKNRALNYLLNEGRESYLISYTVSDYTNLRLISSEPFSFFTDSYSNSHFHN